MPHFNHPKTLLVLLGASLLVACSPKPAAEEPLRSVKVMQVGVGTLSSSAEFAGEVRGRVESRLGFRVPGKIIQRKVEPGQRVRAGEVLAQLDPQDLQLASEAARAQLSAATTNRDLAAADFKRFKELRDQNFISSAELERRESALKAAQAQWEQARAQASGQSNQASYASLVASAPGVVIAVDAEVGQVVAAGTPIVRIAQDGPRDVVFAVAEDKAAAVRLGSKATVTAWGANNSMTAVVREVAASADPVTRTFTVKAELPAAQPMPLGTTVAVRPQALESQGAQVIKLPTSAIWQNAGKTAVWVLDTQAMTVSPQPIEVATADGNDVVVRSGLQPGMQVVVAGVHVLAPGQKVSLYQSRAASARVNAANASASHTPVGQ